MTSRSCLDFSASADAAESARTPRGFVQPHAHLVELRRLLVELIRLVGGAFRQERQVLPPPVGRVESVVSSGLVSILSS